jgi:hypothetical protein
MGFAPAATGFHALAKDGLRQHRRGGGAVTRQHRWSWTPTSRTICAPMFSIGSSRSISFATVTPSFGDGRAAILLIEDDVAALWSERDLHCVGELIDPAQDCRARFFAMSYSLCHNPFVLLSINVR